MGVLAATLLDMPLVYSGQESYNTDRLRFFEKDTVAWGDYIKADFYRQLNELNHTREALWNGDFGGAPQLLKTSSDDDVFAFFKEKNGSTVVVILNLSDTPQEVPLTLPDAEFEVAMGQGAAEGGTLVKPFILGATACFPQIGDRLATSTSSAKPTFAPWNLSEWP